MAFSLEMKEKINELIFENYDFNIKNENMLIYGLEEYSEEFFKKNLLKNIYGDITIKSELYEIENYNKTVIEIKKSDYHIEFNPSKSGSDRYALLGLIKDYGKSQMINMVISGTINNKRTIIINKIDDLNYYCQASLRRNMEKYSNVTNFILISKNLSKVTEPIRSRCSLLTIENFDKKKVLKKVFPDIKVNSDYSLSHNLLNYELKRSKLGNSHNLEDYIIQIFNLQKQTFNEIIIKKLKLIIYNIYISNYSLDNIIIEISNYIIKSSLDINLKYSIFKEIVKTNNNLNSGKRYLIHFENLFIKIFKLLTINKIKL